MKRLPRALAALGLAAALTAAGLPTASAASWGPIDPVSYSVKDVTVSSAERGCTDRTISMSAKKAPFTGVVPKHSLVFVSVQDPQDQYIGQEALVFQDPKFNNKAKRYSASMRWPVCNGATAFGRYTVGLAEIRYGNSVNDLWEASGDTLTATDTTLAHYYVRRASKAVIKATRSGKKVTLSVAAKRYNPIVKTAEWGERYDAITRYSTYSGQKVRFEVKSGKTWKPLKTVTLSKGKASLKVSSSSKRQYRAVLVKNSTTAGKTTSTVRR